MYQLYGREGWGSALIEAQLEWYGLPYRFERVGDLFADAAAREALAKLNPLAQVPTLVTAGGEVLAESLAITLWLAETNDSEDWVPLPTERCRGRFLRWLTFCVSTIYPTFTYADIPARFVPMTGAQPGFVACVEDWRNRAWTLLEAEASGPWFLGERMSAIDLYIAVMSRWEPRRPWFAGHGPKLHAIATAIDLLPPIDAVMARNFPAKA